MKKLMSHLSITNAIGAMILAVVVLAAPAGKTLAAGGIERAAAPRSERDVQYAVIELELSGSWTSARPYAMNEQGQIVGQGRYSGDDRAFLWDDGEMTNLGVLPGHWHSEAYDINSSGVIVGYSTGGTHAVVWVDGEIIDLGVGKAYAVNDAGTIVGDAADGGPSHAVIGDVTGWQIDIGANWPGWYSVATGISEDGVVVGWVWVDLGYWCGIADAFMWDDGEITMLWQPPEHPDQHFIPWDINHAREIVGEHRCGFYMDCGDWGETAWAWHAGEGGFLPAPDPDYSRHTALAMNDAGDAVGWGRNLEQNAYCGALWRDGVAYDLNDLIDPESPWHIEAAYDIDSQGRILAYEYPHPLLLLPIKPGDIDEDGDVDTTDLLALLGAWGECEGCPEDIDGNGVVNTADLLILLGNWG